MKPLQLLLAASLLLSPTACLRWPGPMPGSYRPALSSDPEIIAAAQAAISLHNAQPGTSQVHLLSIREATQQVVAGMNYRLWLRVSDSGRTRTANALIYRDLSGHHSLTSWAWE